MGGNYRKSSDYEGHDGGFFIEDLDDSPSEWEDVQEFSADFFYREVLIMPGDFVEINFEFEGSDSRLIKGKVVELGSSEEIDNPELKIEIYAEREGNWYPTDMRISIKMSDLLRTARILRTL